MSSQDFKGKLAIVTGGSKQNGIGFATAYALAKAGADILLHYNSNADAASRSADIIRALGVKVAIAQGDAGSPSFGHDLVAATLAAFPGRQIDIIVNNAGHATFQASASQAALDPAEFDASFHPNVRGPHLSIQAASPHSAAPGGRIVNVGSVVARTGATQAALYSASKGASNTLTSAWAEESGEKGITVNVVAPGPIETDYAPPEEHDLTRKFRAQQNVKRNGTAEEVANVIVFAVSDRASFVSGQVLAVDGGSSYA